MRFNKLLFLFVFYQLLPETHVFLLKIELELINQFQEHEHNKEASFGFYRDPMKFLKPLKIH